tara:strand:+ start:83 stop:1669 length:1587 start_codon:yes stop_codon:yes gene_type:complete
MQYLITNKMIKFLLFVSFLLLVSCTLEQARPDNQTEFAPELVSDSSLAIIENTSARSSPTQSAEGLWQRLLALYQFPAVENERVQSEIDWYLKHPEYLARVQKNAAPYLYFIVDEIEKRQLPGELALLPVIESAFRPFAYSHGRASGLWQFIPSTGRYYGLKQTWWYDGRRDVYASTHAALDYMDKLSTRFNGDWFLALAAYNAGGGNISKAIKKNRRSGKKSDFWSLKLRKETLRYVPKLIAITHILSHAEQYNIDLLEIPNAPYFEKINVVKQIDLAKATELAEIEIDELYELNPAFNQWATDPQGPHYLLIPIEKSERFKQSIAQLPDEQRLRWRRHKIKKGETLSHIAKQYRTSVALIKQTNHVTGHAIRAGKYLLIPSASIDSSLYTHSQTMRKKAIVGSNRPGKRLHYRVKKGDSFWTIARQHKVSVRQLAKWNAMAPGDTIKPSQKLTIWQTVGSTNAASPVTPARKNQTISYTVKNGDSLYLISRRFKVSINELKEWNTLNNKYLKPGQRLKIIVDVTRS